jgi:hypothetical protein
MVSFWLFLVMVLFQCLEPKIIKMTPNCDAGDFYSPIFCCSDHCRYAMENLDIIKRLTIQLRYKKQKF